MATGNENFPVHFGEVAPRLTESGWRPLPLRPDTKIPAIPGWSSLNQRPWSANELAVLMNQFADHACGIAISAEHFVVDIDILDEQIAIEAEAWATRILGGTPLVRIGMPPKRVMIYRSDGSTTSKRPHPIEIFAGSGQVGVFGWHQKANKPYTWPYESILDRRADDPGIPCIDARKQREFLAAIAHITKPKEATRRTSPRAGRSAVEANDPSFLMTTLLTRGLRFNRAAEQVLAIGEIGQRHATVRAVVSAGFNLGMSAETIEAVIYRHSPEATLNAVLDDGYLVRVMRDFTPKTINRRYV